MAINDLALLRANPICLSRSQDVIGTKIGPAKPTTEFVSVLEQICLYCFPY